VRLDLVLNDFVAGALASGEISILSDGAPWRPMINTKDMARAIEWGILRDRSAGGAFLAVNAGRNEWNIQIKPLAEAVAAAIPGTRVYVNREAAPDRRSYRVNFDLFRQLAPDHQPVHDLVATINELKDNLTAMGFRDRSFRESDLIRLKVLDRLQETGRLNDELEWV
jgi:nucleoside-diphosphate-sugar epimerase